MYSRYTYLYAFYYWFWFNMFIGIVGRYLRKTLGGGGLSKILLYVGGFFTFTTAELFEILGWSADFET